MQVLTEIVLEAKFGMLKCIVRASKFAKQETPLASCVATAKIPNCLEKVARRNLHYRELRICLNVGRLDAQTRAPRSAELWPQISATTSTAGATLL